MNQRCALMIGGCLPCCHGNRACRSDWLRAMSHGDGRYSFFSHSLTQGDSVSNGLSSGVGGRPPVRSMSS